MNEAPSLPLECPAEWHHPPAAGATGKVELQTEEVHGRAARGAGFTLALRDITAIRSADYRIHLFRQDGAITEIFNLGYRYEDFLRALMRQRNRLLQEDLLMREKLRFTARDIRLARRGADGKETVIGNGDLLVYETGLVVVPESEELFRIPFGLIERVVEEPYRFLVVPEECGILVFSMMGNQLDPTKKIITDILAELEENARRTIADLVPQLPPEPLTAAARLLRDGRAAARPQLESLAPGVWPALEGRLAGSPLAEEYRFLAALGDESQAAIGIKRGLFGEWNGDYLWLLMPLPTANAVAFSATTLASAGGEEDEEESGSKATYFFRLTDPGEAAPVMAADAQRAWERLLPQINRALLAVNFRREPIYLGEAQLQQPHFRKYRHTLHRLPALQLLRRRFLGRAVHTSARQWEETCRSILSRAAAPAVPGDPQ